MNNRWNKGIVLVNNRCSKSHVLVNNSEQQVE